MSFDQKKWLIRAENLSKTYRLFDQPHHRLLQSLAGSRRRYYREFDALKDVNFQLECGETMGIIGTNGAGKSTTLRDNPDKTAAFRVLKTAQVPAVLIELAYFSNQQDASNLRSEEWRRKVTDSIMTAIENYFGDPSTRVPM